MVVKQVCGIFNILGVLKERLIMSCVTDGRENVVEGMSGSNMKRHINIVMWFVFNILLGDKYVYCKPNTDMV